jgi:TRAP-type uncharacterized transport system substrate-binding protein
MESKRESEREPARGHRHHGAKLRLPLKITTVSWSDLAHTLGPILIASAAAIWLALHFVRPLPPRTLTMSGGPKGSSFELDAEKYRAILARSGIRLKIVPSAGSLQNLQRLAAPHSRFDVALVQAGITSGAAQGAGDLVSLGSMFYQPLTVWYRGRRPISRLSQLQGKRIAIGKEGSGTRLLALALLGANGIGLNGPTQLLDFEGEAARQALLDGRVDAIFLTGDSAPPATIRAMLHTRGVRMFRFVQADAYTRRFPYLHELEIPEGAFDLGANLPARPLVMLAPAVELIAHSDLHPALCDLLIEAAQEVHGRHASLLQSAGEFPNPSTDTFPLDSEAARYYKSGNRSLAYRYLPFTLASLVTRIAVVLVPIVVILIPGLRYLPNLYRWRVDSRIHRRYGELMALERESLGELTPERRAALIERLEEIERSVILRKIPGSHAEQLYQLREHIGFVRRNLSRSAAQPQQEPAVES